MIYTESWRGSKGGRSITPWQPGRNVWYCPWHTGTVQFCSRLIHATWTQSTVCNTQTKVTARYPFTRLFLLLLRQYLKINTSPRKRVNSPPLPNSHVLPYTSKSSTSSEISQRRARCGRETNSIILNLYWLQNKADGKSSHELCICHA